MKIKYKIGDKFQEQRYGMIYILSKSKISKYDFYVNVFTENQRRIKKGINIYEK